MTRPGHVPEGAWAQCETEAAWRLAPEATEAGLATMPSGMTPGGVGLVGGAALGLVGQIVTDAVAPDAGTAAAWRWNHVMRVCLEDRGVRLP
jgi:hypothetical protein